MTIYATLIIDADDEPTDAEVREAGKKVLRAEGDAPALMDISVDVQQDRAIK
ncbi:MAG TPA: hypothetical protein VK669_07570 [Candidatus Limnocylindrales bacterium]|nr:hypothetical protein [Candidatus Limnocylindrales bacterium]